MIKKQTNYKTGVDQKDKKTYAFVDGANLHKGVDDQGWAVNYRRFRTWLFEKLKVQKAFLFIGLVPGNSRLYTSLQEAGFILIFKPTITNVDGKVKGNCDADMVLTIVSGAYEKKFDKAVLVTSDGDFYSTVEFLQKRKMLTRIVSPSLKCSILLKRTNASITYIGEIKNLVEYKQSFSTNKKKKPPMKTKHHKGLFRNDSRLDNSKKRVKKSTRRL